MEYIPKLTDKEIEENHGRFAERAALYGKKGLDFAKSRKFILEKASPLSGSILEIGTGRGHTALSLAKAGYKIISIDKDKESLKLAALNLAYEKVLSNVKFYVMDGGSLNFANGSFENIVAVNLFHHIEKIDRVLSEIDRVLRGNGKAVLADFNKKGMSIIDIVHRQEGNTHENHGAGRDSVGSYFHGLGYEIQNYAEECNWILIAKKRIGQ
ncbi:MAG: methyltransferase domain-containing protein [Candidatus Omnitrophota bacterium]|nr:methyltransferase domain-containing protein [Candidatus Omnitrophota bacterium]